MDREIKPRVNYILLLIAFIVQTGDAITTIITFTDPRIIEANFWYYLLQSEVLFIISLFVIPFILLVISLIGRKRVTVGVFIVALPYALLGMINHIRNLYILSIL